MKDTTSYKTQTRDTNMYAEPVSPILKPNGLDGQEVALICHSEKRLIFKFCLVNYFMHLHSINTSLNKSWNCLESNLTTSLLETVLFNLTVANRILLLSGRLFAFTSAIGIYHKNSTIIYLNSPNSCGFF
ncbi:hypothetical protein EGR_02177 [Echinococcus granulosus]|uniref:Uncharacterized protein n=1 Tax=Echinococcus granulosus TaxID=6210 RepID=W6UPC4_ECHGR|nr:hypothetical protein EGR_02177 [Echinococcus granulosus]EUB63083.1 hypothetical protein EGR_02177 [Echinococcus granulosus]